MNFYQSIYIHILISLFSVFFACSPVQQPPKAHKGVIDLRNWNFEKNPTIELNGEWEFYWQQLLTQQDFESNRTHFAQLTGMMQIPSFWNDYEVDGKTLGGRGFATFRLKLLLPKDLPPLKLRCPYVGSAYKLFANEGLISRNGKVGRTVNESRGESRVVYTSLSSKSQQQLVIQISNFQNARGGFWYSMVLGTTDNIGDFELMNLWWEGFLSDVIIMMGLYHLVLFAFRKQDRTTLWFGTTTFSEYGFDFRCGTRFFVGSSFY